MMTSLDLSVDDMIWLMKAERGSEGLGAVMIENYEAEAIARQLDSAKEMYRLLRILQNDHPAQITRGILHHYECAGRYRHDQNHD